MSIVSFKLRYFTLKHPLKTFTFITLDHVYIYSNHEQKNHLPQNIHKHCVILYPQGLHLNYWSFE